jgi:hypothetical protein
MLLYAKRETGPQNKLKDALQRVAPMLLLLEVTPFKPLYSSTIMVVQRQAFPRAVDPRYSHEQLTAAAAAVVAESDVDLKCNDTCGFLCEQAHLHNVAAAEAAPAFAPAAASAESTVPQRNDLEALILQAEEIFTKEGPAESSGLSCAAAAAAAKEARKLQKAQDAAAAAAAGAAGGGSSSSGSAPPVRLSQFYILAHSTPTATTRAATRRTAAANEPA